MSNTDQPQEGHLSDNSDYGDLEGYSTEISSDGEGYRTRKAIFKSRFPWVATKFGKGEAVAISRRAIKEGIVRDYDEAMGTFMRRFTTIDRHVSIYFARHWFWSFLCIDWDNLGSPTLG